MIFLCQSRSHKILIVGRFLYPSRSVIINKQFKCKWKAYLKKKKHGVAICVSVWKRGKKGFLGGYSKNAEWLEVYKRLGLVLGTIKMFFYLFKTLYRAQIYNFLRIIHEPLLRLIVGNTERKDKWQNLNPGSIKCKRDERRV